MVDRLDLKSRLSRALHEAQAALLAARSPQDGWEGRLSSSALSTATAVTALAIVLREATQRRTDSAARDQAGSFSPHRLATQVEAGLRWLARFPNPDGGWGDTTLSVSNLSTTTLCWAAFHASPGARERHRKTVDAAEDWLRRQVGSIEQDRLAPAIIGRYGKDRTFSVPILTMCALAGCLGSGSAAWRHVIPLRFELAALPHAWFAALRLQVVSYALPALIAIGQARHFHAPSRNPLLRALRQLARQPTLRRLQAIQPPNGGFLEATPLTSFVVMSLAGSGQLNHQVTRRGVEFLSQSTRADGSWPIDTNLATWLTTLSVNALGSSAAFPPESRRLTRDWLLAQQYQEIHPYTQAPPGGWAWTDLPGGVPDADDTAGALLALHHLNPPEERRCRDPEPIPAEESEVPPQIQSGMGKASDRLPTTNYQVRSTGRAIRAGVEWLLGLQNRDGGIPTFCRGWGALPFDRSSPDLTAHAVRAWLAWRAELPAALRARVEDGLLRAARYLCRAQRAGGEWVPLWFGSQHAAGEENPTYGTARVLEAVMELLQQPETCSGLTSLGTMLKSAAASGTAWLLRAQNSDGSWGGATGIAGSIEETALAVEALSRVRVGVSGLPGVGGSNLERAWAAGVRWLLDRVESGTWKEPAPIGFYFARLWYYEELYPVVFTAGALRRAAEVAGQGEAT